MVKLPAITQSMLQSKGRTEVAAPFLELPDELDCPWNPEAAVKPPVLVPEAVMDEAPAL